MTLQAIARNGLQSPTLQVIEFTGAGDFGNNGSSNPAFFRDNLAPGYSDFSISFRSVLYVNL